MNKEQNRLAIINYCDYGSTGRIALAIAEKFKEAGGEAKVFVFDKKTNSPDVINVPCGKLSNLYNHGMSRIMGADGFYFKKYTKKLIKEIKKYKPTILNLHNIHNYYLNLKELVHFINEEDLKVYWTLHDSWILTGRCCNMDRCVAYKNECKKCPYKDIYPASIFHNEHKYYLEKTKLIKSIKDLTFVTPCEFLADIVKNSKIYKNCIEIIKNGIDISLFNKVETSLKQELRISEEKIVLLDVAFPFSEFKGAKYLNKLANELPDKYQIVCVGSLDDVELDPKILHIGRVEQSKLVEYYSMADIFVNPTMSDNYPTVDMEAICCHLPVITFDTGGSKEIVDDTVGVIVPQGNYIKLKQEILKFDASKFNQSSFEKKKESFSNSLMLDKYISLLKD